MSIPLSYFFGHTAPGKNVTVYKTMVENLASAVDKRMKINSAERAAGLVVNTCGWVDGEGYALLLHACKALQCDVVLVLGHDRLFNSLQTDLAAMEGTQQTTVLKLPRSGGVMERNVRDRKDNRMHRIRQYFYGCSAHRDGKLQPATIHVGFDDVKIFEIGESLKLAKEMTPQSSIDTGTASLTSFRLGRLEPTRSMMHSVLACSFAQKEAELLDTNVAGFVYITSVDEEARTITMMAPCAGQLPGPFLLMGSLKWIEA